MKNSEIYKRVSEKFGEKIVIGKSDRPITSVAFKKLLEIAKKTDDEVAYLIYSDSSEIAAVWDEDEDNIARDAALSYLEENCLANDFTATEGVLYSGTVDLFEYYTEKDRAYRSEKWDNLEKEQGVEIATALKNYYSLFSTDTIKWLADLYEPNICVCKKLYGKDTCEHTKYCGTGGFYYSNSARDNLGYLPDVESTIHAFTLIEYLGLADRRGSSWTSVLPEEMKEQIGKFVYSLEEPNGYFYHPQWDNEFTDKQISGRGRYLSASTEILKTLGITPKYTTATGFKGEETAKASLGENVSCPASEEKSKTKEVSKSYEPHFQDLNAYKKYLDSLDINHRSYFIGNTFEAESRQLIARDIEIGTADDPTPLQDALFTWLAEKQNPKNGTWDFRQPGDEGYSYFELTNGVMKIFRTYETCKRPFPNALAAVNTALDAVLNTEEDDAFLCCVYNPWVIVRGLIKNIRKFEENGEKIAEDILKATKAKSIDAINVTKMKISPYLKPDGSGSMTKGLVEPLLNGCPAAVRGTDEGELNGANIALGATLDAMCKALKIDRPPVFGERERYIFRKEITKRKSNL